MPRFQKKVEKLGFRTSDFFKGRSAVPKFKFTPTKGGAPRPQSFRLTQHKG